MRDKIVKLALEQVGIKEIPQNEVKYNTWYYGRKVNGSSYAWCAVFVSWLANECGIMNKLIPSYSGCGTGVNWFKNRGLWLNGGNKPNKGDIIFFKPTKAGATSSHTGIVVDVTDKSVITVEGNKSNQVKKCEYSFGFKEILGYGTPKYDDTTTTDKPITKKVYYQTYDNVKDKWLNTITSNEGSGIMAYAGNFGNAIGGIRIKTSDNSSFKIASHIKGGNWLSEITKWDNTSNGYSGIYNKPIDAVMIKCDNIKFEYRVHLMKSKRWLSWVNGYNKNDSRNGYAGNIGETIDAIQIRVV